jgi:hypothetical protein
VLTNTKLSYTEETSVPDEMEDEEENGVSNNHKEVTRQFTYLNTITTSEYSKHCTQVCSVCVCVL